MAQDVDPQSMTLEEARLAILDLFDVVETVKGENQALREENRRLRDEIARLKGEQGRPTFPMQTGAERAGPRDFSSEKERSAPGVWKKGSKLAELAIDRTEIVPIDRTTVPADAVFKGYEDVVIQELICRRDTVRFRKEKYYASSTGRTYLAELPPGYEGQFGPNLKALAVSLAFGANVSESKLREFLGQAGVSISAGGLSNLLIQGKAAFHAETAAAVEAGLRSSPWQHLDETGTRVKGIDRHCHVLCNPLYTAYFTLPGKSRLNALEALRGGRPPVFALNGFAWERLEAARLPKAILGALSGLPQETMLPEAELHGWLAETLPSLGPRQRTEILEALALGAHRAEGRTIDLLICDDAPQFKELAEALALCWVHEGRLYKKLLPYVPFHQRQLEAFLKEFWDYYRELGAYRQAPAPAESVRLSARFDAVFGQVTGYGALDERIALTRGKKASLLQVLVHPEIPLHNNPAELGARRRVRKRDVSFGPQTAEGSRAWDTFMTLAATTAQLGVNFYDYLKDRITQAGRIPPLAALITERAPTLRLGDSWVT